MKLLFYISCISVALLCGCKKDDLNADYFGEARILLFGDASQGAKGDSIVYVFANYPKSQTEKNINIRVQLVGKTTAHERSFSIVADEARSTALPSEYSLPANLQLPANAYEVIVPVTIQRTARLVTDTARLVLKAGSTPDIKVDASGNTGESIEFNIIWLDKLIQPESWPFYRWGQYSRVKHQLVIDVTGVSDYSVLSSDDLYVLALQCNEYIRQYNDQHPGEPMKDENGKEFNFCPTCF